MNPGCTPFRDELLLAHGENAELPHELRTHLEGCGECSAWLERMSRGLEVLGKLPALEAPAELDGRVVATLHAGFREDRSVRHLRQLSGLQAPAELEANLSHSEALSEDLFARVEQELLHPERSVGSRLARVTSRLDVPQELEQLVARDLEITRSTSLPRLLTPAAGGLLAAAALVMFWLGFATNTDVPARPTSLSFTVRQVDSATELAPMARTLMGGVTGGASEARKF